MERLTFKVNDAYYVKDPIQLYNNTWELVQKLGQLEDIEEELGIDLITLFKALKNGIYIKDNNLIEHLTDLQLDFSLITNEYSFYCDYYIQYYRLKDYENTWWLDRRE